MEHLKKLQSQGITALYDLSEKILSNMIISANKSYYNEEEIIPDSIYDILKEYIKKHYPNNMAIKMIGAPVDKKKVKLPYEMWSMDKIKDINKWKAKYCGDKLISAKLDGVSGLYSTEGGIPKLYTRGNGRYGQDISHIIPFLQLPFIKGATIRGEFIIKKDVFEAKYKGIAANPRSFVSGTVNLKKPKPDRYKDIDFIAYEVIQPILKPSEQMEWLKKINVKIVQNCTYAEISNEMLSVILTELRANYEYEADGIIVTDDNIYKRESNNPKYAFAFKMILTEQIAETTVLDVIWTPSKDGFLKPKIHFEPVIIGGACIEYATGFNAEYIVTHRIGIGAVVQIMRSGDVIPHILQVISPAYETKMPTEDYIWNKTKVDILLKNPEENSIVRLKNITRFFVTLGVDGLSSGNIKRIIDAGFDTIPKILRMYKKDFLSCEGFQQKRASKILQGIKKKIKEARLSQLMAATNLMGRGLGEKRLALILEEYPDILTSTTPNKIELVAGIDGFADKTATLFVKQIPAFLHFIEKTRLQYKLTLKIAKSLDAPLFGKSIVFTGCRPEKELLKKLLELTGKPLSNNITRGTFLLVVKDLSSNSNKMIKAKKLEVPVLAYEEFIKAPLLQS